MVMAQQKLQHGYDPMIGESLISQSFHRFDYHLQRSNIGNKTKLNNFPMYYVWTR